MNELRRDPITGRAVLVAAGRDARPNQYEAKKVPDRELAQTQQACPFCFGQMDTPPIIEQFGGENPWQVCVVPNLYPVLSAQESRSGVAQDASVSALFKTRTVEGFHEVVIESPVHTTRLSDLSGEQFRLMLEAYRSRICSMRDRGCDYVQVMKNQGRDAGASLMHTHSQIFGMHFVPETVERELQGALKYQQTNQSCVYCDLVAAELGAKERVVATNDHFVAWCPFASRFALETWIAPRTHTPRFEEATDDLLETLASLFRMVMRKLESHPRVQAFNYLIHTAPFGAQADHYHWHIEIIPRVAKLAGFEWGTGVHINTIPPERAAAELRQALQ